jgi:hypothetical protein
MGEQSASEIAVRQALEQDDSSFGEMTPIDTSLVSEGVIGKVTESVGKWTHSLQTWLETSPTGKSFSSHFLLFLNLTSFV